jgi:DNA-binding winged helix-turn-helix (wHTH) protein/Flp pilus assembly protein TadD
MNRADNFAQEALRWSIGDSLLLDLRERRLSRDEVAITLPPRAFDLLAYMTMAGPQLLSKDELLAHVWTDRVVEEGTLSRHVWLLRKALGPDAALLETVAKSGYRLNGTRPLPLAPAPGLLPNLAKPADQKEATARSSTGRDASTEGGPRRRLASVPILLACFALVALVVALPILRDGTARQARQEAELLGLRAEALTARRAEADLIEAIRLYRQAVELAPESAALHAGLAASLALASGVALPAGGYDSARLHALKALELDPGHAPALTVLGLVAMNRDRDWPVAEALFREALGQEPAFARAHHWLGELLVLLGERQQEGLNHLQKAHSLQPDSVAIASDLAKAAYFSRRNEEAISAADAAIGLDPAFAHAYRWRGLAMLAQGRCAEASMDLRAATRLDPSPIVRAEQIHVLGRCGQLQQARELTAQLEHEATAGYLSPVALLLARLGTGDTAAALDALDELVQTGNMTLGLATAPTLDSLRSEARFQAVLARLQPQQR